VSGGVILEDYCKNVYTLCYQTLTLFLQIINTETGLDRQNYFWRLLNKICALWNFKQPWMVIPFLRFGHLIGLIFNALTIQVVLTSRSLLDVYIRIVKYYSLCDNMSKILKFSIRHSHWFLLTGVISLHLSYVNLLYASSTGQF